MRIRLIMDDKDYCVAFKNAITSSDKDIFVEIGEKGVIKGLGNKTVLLTDIDPDCVDEKLWHRTVFLTMNPIDSVDGAEDKCFKTFKYSPVSKILSDIEEVDFLLTGESGKIYSANSRIYALCSDIYSKKFDLAKSVARQIIFRRGGKILLVSMKYINEYSEPNGADNSKFTKLMYYLKEIIRSLPRFTNQLLLMLNSGMILSDAFDIIAKSYKLVRTESRGFFESEVIRVAEINEDHRVSTANLINEWANKHNVKELLRISTILTENEKRGSNVIDNLSRESRYLWDDRKIVAREAGKMIDTKMSYPMGLLLLLLIVITMAPAMFNL